MKLLEGKRVRLLFEEGGFGYSQKCRLLVFTSQVSSHLPLKVFSCKKTVLSVSAQYRGLTSHPLELKSVTRSVADIHGITDAMMFVF